jgi:hypothetical protein
LLKLSSISFSTIFSISAKGNSVRLCNPKCWSHVWFYSLSRILYPIPKQILSTPFLKVYPTSDHILSSSLLVSTVFQTTNSFCNNHLLIWLLTSAPTHFHLFSI